ncbi:hypothetical protein O4J56_09510 [Nocardiopsis sp. RSe5-2]|uniref:DUF397 domain-containing protein n=1 Tax=Nocardiopsis endophytica TaxID=3018445 RepID=A0ABT4U1Q1_9ACTN|nr:hypothetical protein [Nocardiopsis endophytica]MDA2810870.1 hypothetical protein [Nocardiopsis endophytica]
MQLRFIGKDPESGKDGSPSVFIDDATGDFVLQGWKVDADTRQGCRAAGPVPPHEDIVRMPTRMIDALRKACDEAERSRLH